jgi:hypothetical protein
MSNFVITSEEIRNIHNGLCYLRDAIDRLEDTLSPHVIKELRKAKSEIEKGFSSVRFQKENQWDDRNEYYTQLKERCKLKSVWSMYEVEDLEEKAFDLEEGSVLVHDNFSVPLPAGSVSWFQLWMAAEEAIYAVGGDHIFIESLTQSSINPKIILLGTGS